MGFALLRHRPHLRRLWIAGAVSLVGDWLSFVAVSLLVLDHGGGAVSMALVLAAHALPHALLSPVAGPIADRFDRRRLLLGANLAEAGITILMALAALHGRAGVVQALVFARGAVGAFVVPAEGAALARVVPADELGAANTLISTTWSVAFVAGMAAGGALASLGPALAITFDAASFLVAALILRPLPPMRPEASPAAAATTARGIRAILGAVPADLRAALSYARARPDLWRAVLGKAPAAVAGGGGFIVLNLMVERAAPFGSAALSLGILQAVKGAGTGVGPVLAAAFMRRGGSGERAGVISVAVMFGAIAAFSLGPPAILLVPLVFAWGLGTGSNWVLSTTTVQRLAPDRFLGRLSAANDLSSTLGQVLGALLGGAVADATGTPAAAAWVSVAAGSLVACGLSLSGAQEDFAQRPQRAQSRSAQRSFEQR
jgi:MFS family permease